MKINNLLMAVLLSVSVAFVSCKPKDAAVKSAIEAKINADQNLSGVMVDVKNHVVTLSGEVKDESAKATAETAAKSEKGVTSVVNNITVAPSPMTAAPMVNAADSAIEAGMRDLTKDLPDVKYMVKDGALTLTGEISKDKNVKFTQAYMALKPKSVDRKGLMVK